MSDATFLCIQCKFADIQQDDVWTELPNGAVICLYCASYLMESCKPVPRKLRFAVEAELKAYALWGNF